MARFHGGMSLEIRFGQGSPNKKSKGIRIMTKALIADMRKFDGS